MRLTQALYAQALARSSTHVQLATEHKLVRRPLELATMSNCDNEKVKIAYTI
jgi:hypothetical protein